MQNELPLHSPAVHAPTLSHVAVPQDKRCRWFQRIAPAAVVLQYVPENIHSAGDLPGGRYARAGSDHELPAWTCIFDGEAVHHSKDRGWTHTLGMVLQLGDGSLQMHWMEPNAARKATIKAMGASHLIGGSGPNAALVRIARFVLEAPTSAERLERWNLLAATR